MERSERKSGIWRIREVRHEGDSLAGFEVGESPVRRNICGLRSWHITSRQTAIEQAFVLQLQGALTYPWKIGLQPSWHVNCNLVKLWAVNPAQLCLDFWSIEPRRCFVSIGYRVIENESKVMNQDLNSRLSGPKPCSSQMQQLPLLPSTPSGKRKWVGLIGQFNSTSVYWEPLDT